MTLDIALTLVMEFPLESDNNHINYIYKYRLTPPIPSTELYFTFLFHYTY